MSSYIRKCQMVPYCLNYSRNSIALVQHMALHDPAPIRHPNPSTQYSSPSPFHLVKLSPGSHSHAVLGFLGCSCYSYPCNHVPLLVYLKKTSLSFTEHKQHHLLSDTFPPIPQYNFLFKNTRYIFLIAPTLH